MDASAHLDDDASNFKSRRERQQGGEVVFSFGDKDVAEVDSGCVHLNQHFIFFWRWNWHLLQLQQLGSSCTVVQPVYISLLEEVPRICDRPRARSNNAAY